MRPQILNPAFAEIESLKGVGASLQKPFARLGIARVKDMAYHLPTGFIRRRPVANADEAVTGEQIIIEQEERRHAARYGDEIAVGISAKTSFLFDATGRRIR